MEQNPNTDQNIKTTGSPLNDASNTEQAEDQYQFYNVMPQIKTASSLVQPVVKVKEEAPVPPPPSELMEKLKKYKWYVVGAGVLIVGAPLGYFLVNKIGGSGYKEENLLITQPKVPGANNSTSTPQTKLATTITTSKEWQKKYFKNEACTDLPTCGDNADPDHDGLNNVDEFKLGTDPNNPDSDNDGLSDGDEVHIFGTNPLNGHTANNSKYLDADYFKNGYDVFTGKKMTSDQIAAFTQKMNQFMLHEPTSVTLASVLDSVYHFGALPTPTIRPTATSTTASSTTTSQSNLAKLKIDQSLSAKQDRDSQRTNTIKAIGIALVKYLQDNKKVPDTTDFTEMYGMVKPYVRVALNPKDPINIDPYVYGYAPSDKLDDFTLSFYSEVAGQIIKKHALDSEKDMNSEAAGVNDNQRTNDLDNLRTALLLYSNDNIAGDQQYIFPTKDKYKIALVPKYIQEIPKDPKTKEDYDYQVSQTFDTFTLKAPLENPSAGTTGYMCNQDECRSY